MRATPPEPLAELGRRLAESALGPSLRHDHGLADHTTYRVGGPARLFVTVQDLAGLETLASVVSAAAADPPPPVLVVGRGSNLLVADRGFEGLAVSLGAGLARIEMRGSTVVAGGAALLPVVARASAEAALAGFEWAVGVPGTVGGAVRMNAGGHGSDMRASLVEALVADLYLGHTAPVPADRLRLGYRSSDVRAHQVVASATLRLEEGDAARSRAELSEVVRWRRANQPGGRNAGSVFANPDEDAAGRLIEAVGAKGLRIGSAEVSPKHANFIQADEGGRASDVVEVMRAVRRRVKESRGVELRVETRLAGFEPWELP